MKSQFEICDRHVPLQFENITTISRVIVVKIRRDIIINNYKLYFRGIYSELLSFNPLFDIHSKCSHILIFSRLSDYNCVAAIWLLREKEKCEFALFIYKNINLQNYNKL